MSMQQSAVTPEGVVHGNTLREAIEIRRVRGERFSLKEAIGIVVPLTTQLAELHSEGSTLFVYPSVIDHGRAGSELTVERAMTPPTHERDRACVAPELKRGQQAQRGDARASVFSIGAILYELVTGETVGPGMRRPTEAAPGLPSNAEIVLGKALVADPAHRPSDLAALAQALHQLCPSGSMPPPEADVSRLDGDESFEVDVSLSMVPPAPAHAPVSGPRSARRAGGDPFAAVDARTSAPTSSDPTARLSALKASVEGDPRPRYVVIKDGMDHGPFTGVELLQQIATRSFLGSHAVRDTISNEMKEIKDWEQFEPFAQQAQLHQDIKQERVALEAVVSAEKTSMQFKTLIGVGVVVILGTAGAAFWLRHRNNSTHTESVQGDQATDIDSAGGLGSSKANAPGGGGHWTGAAGSFPQIAGGKSCAAAQAAYTEDYSKQGVPPDLGAGDFGAVLNKGSYLNACGVPSDMKVNICVAVQNGAAVGVTVTTTPSSPGISSCVAGQVRALHYPAHPRMDVAYTSF